MPPVDSLAYLFSLEHIGIKFGLANIQTIIAALGHPERAFRSVHVAGTNGKGSVTAMIDAALREAGHRSARYTSPHLVELAERFVINGRPVGTDALREAAGDIRDTVASLRATGALDTEPTFFEVTTAVAFELFRRARVEIAVLEVGLGGRLDATNVVTPAVSVITTIDFDHQQYLGSTLGEIAFEKAGIVKPGVPVVVGKIAPEAFEIIARVAQERGAELFRAWDGVVVEPVRVDTDAPASTAGQRFRLRTPACNYGDIHLALNGPHQVANAVTAVRAIELLLMHGVSVPPEAVVRGFASVVWPGRLERRVTPDGRELILDAAHNPAGAAALASYLEGLAGPRPVLVFAAMRDKDVTGMLRTLMPRVDQIIVTRASSVRSADPAELAREVRALAPDMRVQAAASASEALHLAWDSSSRVVVAGSIFLLGDVMRAIGA
jgi:dihydrofolate synthase/folylpolyglutamate synthase